MAQLEATRASCLLFPKRRSVKTQTLTSNLTSQQGWRWSWEGSFYFSPQGVIHWIPILVPAFCGVLCWVIQKSKLNGFVERPASCKTGKYQCPLKNTHKNPWLWLAFPLWEVFFPFAEESPSPGAMSPRQPLLFSTWTWIGSCLECCS